MELGLFTQPVHRPEKPWDQALAEDREAIILADQLGFSEAWIGEHFTTKAEQIPAPLMFMATLLKEAPSIRFATGVINLPYHNPVVVAAEVAQFDQLSDGRLILGIGPGGLMSDAELFGGKEMPERYRIALEGLDLMIKLWQEDAPLNHHGEFYDFSLEKRVWLSHGVGSMAKPFQQPYPPIALAMVGPGGLTAQTIAERSFIPISANFVPIENVVAQWQDYSQTRQNMGKPADRDIWRVCRNILVTDSDSQAEDILSDPDGTFSYYYRYIRGVRQIEEFQDQQAEPIERLNQLLEVPQALADCVIAGSAATVLDRLIDMTDTLGRFGTLVMVAHDWDDATLWQSSMRKLATDIMPELSRHVDQLPALD